MSDSITKLIFGSDETEQHFIRAHHAKMAEYYRQVNQARIDEEGYEVSQDALLIEQLFGALAEPDPHLAAELFSGLAFDLDALADRLHEGAEAEYQEAFDLPKVEEKPVFFEEKTETKKK